MLINEKTSAGKAMQKNTANQNQPYSQHKKAFTEQPFLPT